MAEEIVETIGCDLGDKQSELCVLRPDRKLERPEPIKTTRRSFTKYFGQI